jgi:hypothetical protein
LKLIPGWPVAFYELKDRSIVHLENSDTQKEDNNVSNFAKSYNIISPFKG